MPDLNGLIERCERATGPARVLDARIWFALVPQPSGAYVDEHAVGWIVGGDREQPLKVPELTASVDNALALVEKVLPGFHAVFETGKYSTCDIKPIDGEWHRDILAATLPLAILLALLRALGSRHD